MWPINYAPSQVKDQIEVAEFFFSIEYYFVLHILEYDIT